MKKILFVAIVALLMAVTSTSAEARGYGPHYRYGYVRYPGGFTRNHGSYYAPNGAYIGSHPRSIYRYKLNHPRMFHHRGYNRRGWHQRPPVHGCRSPRRW